MVELTDEEIQNIWKDTEIGFGGVKAFRAALKHWKGADISEKRLKAILMEIPAYYKQLSRPQVGKHALRRKYSLRSSFELFQMDTAFMPRSQGKIGFLVMYDPFSHMSYSRNLSDKGYEATKEAITSIFDECGVKPRVIACDRDASYVKLLPWLEKNGVLLRFKRGRLKANYAEALIRRIKHKLGLIMRTKLEDTWPDYMSTVIDILNRQPQADLGGLAPIELNKDGTSDPFIRQELAKSGHIRYLEPSFQNRMENQEKTLQHPNTLKLDSLVLVQFGKEAFTKEIHAKTGCLYKITRILGYTSPTIYQISDLHNKKLPGFELTPVSKQQLDGLFEVDEIKARRFVGGKEQLLVGFAFYSSAYDEWVDRDSLETGGSSTLDLSNVPLVSGRPAPKKKKKGRRRR